ncbi:MAG: GNAT family N-acetyltransferase [Haloarculaceae archaeon]
MDIDDATTTDADTVADLWVRLADEQQAHDAHLLADANRGVVREAAVRHAVAGGLLVARDGDRGVVGFVMFEVESGRYEQAVARGLVRNLYVCPEYRNDGLGSDLLTAAEARLVDRGVDVVGLEAMAENEAARRFYRRHGYEPHRVALEKPIESDSH